MNFYELTAVLPGEATASKKKQVKESLDKLIKIFKGEIVENKDWGDIELSYPIKKNTSGFFMFYILKLEGESAKALEEKLRVDEELIRFLMIRLDEEPKIESKKEVKEKSIKTKTKNK